MKICLLKGLWVSICTECCEFLNLFDVYNNTTGENSLENSLTEEIEMSYKAVEQTLQDSENSLT